VRVAFHRSASGEETVMEVVTPDTPGVLYRIGDILTERGYNIHGAKVATLGERTEDTFFLTRQGAPLEDADELQALAEAIRAEFEPAGEAPVQ
jgi:[protein-PII] uridylyltransferase